MERNGDLDNGDECVLLGVVRDAMRVPSAACRQLGGFHDNAHPVASTLVPRVRGSTRMLPLMPPLHREGAAECWLGER